MGDIKSIVWGLFFVLVAWIIVSAGCRNRLDHWRERRDERRQHFEQRWDQRRDKRDQNRDDERKRWQDRDRWRENEGWFKRRRQSEEDIALEVQSGDT